MNPQPRSAEELIHIMRLRAKDFARAKADRVRLEHYRKSKAAMLMKEVACLKDNEGKPLFPTTSSQEREALADPSYTELLDGLAAATYDEEVNRWELEAARFALEVWRTRRADERAEMRLT